MKTELSAKILFCILLVTAALYNPAAAAQQFYIAPDGADTNPGTKSKPFATLEQARDAIREHRAQKGLPNGGVTVYLREGTYPVRKTFTLDPQDSGTQQAPIRYRAFPGETPILTGGASIPPSAFEPVTDPAILKRIISKDARDKILQADLKEIGLTDLGTLQQAGFPRTEVSAGLELIVNGRFMTLARWPNDNTLRLGEIIEPGSAPRYKTVSDKKPCFTYDHDRAELWKQADEIWLYGIFNRTWAPDFTKVESIDTENKQITLASDHYYGLKKYPENWKWDWYYVLNLLEEIDEPGEWYLHRSTGIVYLLPPADMDSAEIRVTLLSEKFMVRLLNTSYVSFSGLTFEYSRENAVQVSGGTNTLLENCVIRNMGGGGVDLNGSNQILANEPGLSKAANGTSSGIQSCEIYGMGTYGIKLGGGDRKTLTPGRNFAVQNHIYNCGRRIKTYNPAIRLSGVANRIANNHIHDLPQFGITFSGNDHIIERNDIHHVVLEFSDAGAIYTAANPSHRGTVIRHNFIHHIGIDKNAASGVYIDYTNCGTKVIGNVFYKLAAPDRFGAVVINGGNDNIIDNNIFIDCRTVLYASNFLNGWGKNEYDNYYKIWKTGLSQINYDQPPYSERYPELVGFFEEDHLNHDRNRFEKNVMVNCKEIFRERYDWEVVKNDNYETDTDPGFVNADQANFALKDDSIVYEKIPGFEKIPFAEIGITQAKPKANKTVVYIVPNTHATIVGWLTDFSHERSYVLNNYLDHLDYLDSHEDYALAVSEVPNLMTMKKFAPQKLPLLKKHLAGGTAELVNAFFLEPTINLSGGEALVKMGVEGLRWNRQVMGIRPRLSWMIDVTGIHCQMPQIVSGLGLEGLVFARNNRAGENLFRWHAPDGSQTTGICIVHYCPPAWREFFKAQEPLTRPQAAAMVEEVRERIKYNPANAPVLMPISGGDYGRAPLYDGQLEVIRKHFAALAPEIDLRFAPPGKFLDDLQESVAKGDTALTDLRLGSAYCFDAFWVSNPRAKQRFRQSEHSLLTAEKLATIASMQKGYAYPAQQLYHCWLQLLLNMDRNALWGAAAGSVFENDDAWDVEDRNDAIQQVTSEITQKAIHSMAGPERGITLFNPLNWQRNDPVAIELPDGWQPKAPIEKIGENHYLCQVPLPSMGIKSLEVQPAAADPAVSTTDTLAGEFSTKYFSIKIDPETGNLVSMKYKPADRELLQGPGNEILLETPKELTNTGDLMVPQNQRKCIARSGDYTPQYDVEHGVLRTHITIRSDFYGDSKIVRRVILYADYPRVDFETELVDIPDDRCQVLAHFALAGEIANAKRGIPYGFSSWDPSVNHPPLEYYQTIWDHREYGYSEAIFPAVRWSGYEFQDGCGLALLDRGITGREINGRSVLLFLMNTADRYRGHESKWLSGRGRHRFEYAVTAHGPSEDFNIPQMAWEYNQPPIVVGHRNALAGKSWLETSENLIVQAMRREQDSIEVRLAECRGQSATGRLSLHLEHESAALTNLAGENPKPLRGNAGNYTFPVRPQQIVTIRFKTASKADLVEPLMSFGPLIPAEKRKTYETRYDLKGHPKQF